MDENVAKAVERLDNAVMFKAPNADYDAYRAIRARLLELEAENERLRNAIHQTHKDFGFELRDPNGTIWQECARLQKENERLRKDRKCLHMYGADGDGSSCYLCGNANPANRNA